MTRLEMSVTALLDRLEARVPEISRRTLQAFVAQIPEYRSFPPHVLDDVHRIVSANVEEWFRVVREGRGPRPSELAEFTSSAAVRAREGVALEALLHAYRLGATVAWDAILEESSGATEVQLEAALEVAGGLMRYLDHVSTAVAKSYLEEREHMVTDEERQHRDVVGYLLSDGCDSSEAEHLSARMGLKLASGYRVGIVAVEKGRSLREVATYFRTREAPVPILAVPEVENVLVLWPVEDENFDRGICEVESVLRENHGAVLIALTGPASDSLSEAVDEARAVLRIAQGRRGIVGLEDVLLEVLINRTSPRVQQVLRRIVDPILEYDRRHHSNLVSTLSEFIAANGSLRDAARALTAHRNTVSYRLRRIRELSGRDPLSTTDLFVLHAALCLVGE